MITLLLVDDQTLFLEGLKALLERQADLRILDVATDGERALEKARVQRPAVILMDVSMPGMNGIETAARLRAITPQSRILALSMHSDPALAQRMVQAGASGYALKDDGFQALVDAIRLVHEGGTYFSSELGPSIHEPSVPVPRPLSRREREVIRLIAAGHGANAIAEQLHISVKTVESHRERIRAKLGIRNTADLIKFAIREGLADL